MITIACVYKKGPKFQSEYVWKLFNAIKSNTTYSFKFVCLTDDTEMANSEFTCIPLKFGWKTWWSKLELFRPELFEKGTVLFFDLDTFILRNIDQLIEATKQRDFIMLRGFNDQALKLGDVPASGIMSWNTESEIPRKIYNAFIEDPEGNIKRTENKAGIVGGQGGDQGFIGSLFNWDDVPKFQDFLPKDYIIDKKTAKAYKQVTPEASVIAWSGYPTLRQIAMKPLTYKWVNKVW